MQCQIKSESNSPQIPAVNAASLSTLAKLRPMINQSLPESNLCSDSLDILVCWEFVSYHIGALGVLPVNSMAIHSMLPSALIVFGYCNRPNRSERLKTSWLPRVAPRNAYNITVEWWPQGLLREPQTDGPTKDLRKGEESQQARKQSRAADVVTTTDKAEMR